ncbi:right-handed parallel beta-helix repeat-containing protein [Pendulispora albinea]|uniref:Right-handed parallel beta-helix repeat-containing protein n=1 Tax=Pendulispora albinea TaxID=2741071 RepID=A0ABZ2M6J3_9BACT
MGDDVVSAMGSMQRTEASHFGWWKMGPTLALVLASGCPNFDVNRDAFDPAQGDGGPDPIGLPSALPRLTAVTVDGSAAGKVRQGYGKVVVRLKGTLLDSITAVTVGKLPGTILDRTPTDASFAVDVPHGAPLGLQVVQLTTASGSRSYPQGVTITPITAGLTGTDTPVDGGVPAGTDESPVRSMAKAVSMAAGGDTVFLRAGTYDRANGDNFVTPASGGTILVDPNIPAGITLKGEGPSTKLVGPGKIGCSTGADARIGLVLAENTRLESLSIEQFCVGVVIRVGNAALHGVTVHNHGSIGAVIVNGTSATLDSIDLHSNVSSGVETGGPAAFVNGRIWGNGGHGIRSSGSGSISMTGTELDHNGASGLTAKDGLSPTPTVVTVRGARIHDNRLGGISIDEMRGSAKLIVENTQFDNNKHSLEATGGWEIQIRRSTFRTSEAHLWLYGASLLDFGTSANRGENIFHIAGEGFYDMRAASSASVPISVYGNEWYGPPRPPDGCSATSPSSAPRSWYISNPGTCPATGNVLVN